MGTDGVTNSRLAEALARLPGSCYRIALVVGPAASGKTAMLLRLGTERGWPLVNLGLELSRRLLDLSQKQRRLEAAGLVADIVEECGQPTVLVDNTEIVFDPSLSLNPLGLLQAVSRRQSLVWSCSGRLEDGHLVHSRPGHPEFHRIPVGEFQVVEVQGERSQ